MTLFGHLLWKEYRAIRAFWLALIVLAVGLASLVVALSTDAAWTNLFVYNLALAAPAFFALGCAGTAFALEKEDGTFEWLRASPVKSGQVFGSKLVLAIAATLAMYLVLWPLAWWWTGGQVPAAAQFRGMLGLWLTAALEAIAWGTLCSLLAARPLVAICLALFCTSTVTHLLGFSVAEGHVAAFEFSRYLTALPYRLAVVAMVAVADVYLGLRWLQDVALRRETPRPGRPRDRWPVASETVAESREPARGTMRRRERTAMWIWLVWQTFRQSGRLMAVLVVLHVASTAIVIYSGVDDYNSTAPLIPVAIGAALLGSCVFLADQERHSYRFFVEHNVPPRYVWLARIVPWGLAAGVSCLLICAAWLLPFWDHLSRMNAYPVFSSLDNTNAGNLPPIPWVFVLVALAFAAGQWASMMVRSGLLAGVCGILFAGLLGGWAVLSLAVLQLSWVLVFFPIPLVLLWATWWRAPEWILEVRSWPARSRVAAAVLVPAVLILVSAAWLRVHEVPSVVYLPASDASWVVSDAARETADLYRRASELYVSLAPNDADLVQDSNESSLASVDRAVTDRERHWLAENSESLALLLEAAAQRVPILRPENDPGSCGFGSRLGAGAAARHERGNSKKKES